MTDKKITTGLPAKAVSFFLVLALALGLFPWAAAFPVYGANQDVGEDITLTSLEVKIDGATVYDKAQGASEEPITLKASSVLEFELAWEPAASGAVFEDGDHFTIPVVSITNLNLRDSFKKNLVMKDDDSSFVTVGVGEFFYQSNQLYFKVVFNAEVESYDMEGGSASGSAAFKLSSSLTGINMSFEDGAEVSLVTGNTDPGKLPDPPKYPEELSSMNKRALSGVTGNGEVDASNTYDTIPVSGSKKVGLDWRISFFDLLDYFREEDGKATDDVIIEDVVSANQSFSNFRYTHSSGRDSGFARHYNKETPVPFYIEIPIVAYGSSRVYNIVGGTSLDSSDTAYISTYIRGDQLTQITGADLAERVKETPLSWGVEKLPDGEKLIVNLGRLGPDVSADEGIRVGMVTDSKAAYTIIDDKIIPELLSAQQALDALRGSGGSERDIATWEQVRREALDTLRHYWPALGGKLCDALEIGANSTVSEIVDRLDELGYIGLSGVGIGSLGYDNESLADDMYIDSFALRYRTVVDKDSTEPVSNQATVSTDVMTKQDTAEYNHEFTADIVGSVSKGEIAFIKADSMDGHRTGEVAADDAAKVKGLAGFVFEVYETNGSTPLSFTHSDSGYTLASGGETQLTTDAGGVIKIAGLYPSRSYYLKEVDGPDGYYTLQNQRNTFQVNRNASKFYVVANAPRVVRLTKTDLTSGSGLAGAEFALYKNGGSRVTGFSEKSGYFLYDGQGTADLLTPAGGVLELRGLPAGDYYLQETKAPDGYLLSGEQIPFTLDEKLPETNVVVDLGKVTNRKSSQTEEGDRKLAVYKVDDKTGERLPGAEFTLRYPDGSTRQSTTDQNGLAEFPLKETGFAGTYTITEFRAPEGYLLNSGDVAFTIDAGQKIDSLTGYTHVQRVDENTGLRIENTRNGSDNSKPDKEGSKPDTGTSTPDKDGSKPDKDGSKPDTGTSTPDKDGSTPDKGTSTPSKDKSKDRDNTGTSTPDKDIPRTTDKNTVKITEGNAPKSNAPGGGKSKVEDDVDENVDFIQLGDDGVPLANLPQTGLDHPGLRVAGILAAGSVLTACALLLSRRKK